jgi:serine/threonine protein kinase
MNEGVLSEIEKAEIAEMIIVRDLAIQSQIPEQELPGIIGHPDYKVEKFLGEGAWGQVYKAEHLPTESTVAIKVIDPTELAKRQMDDRELDLEEIMKKERGVLAACRSVVPRYLEHDLRDKPFIVMPYYESTLESHIKDKSFFGVQGDTEPDDIIFDTGFRMSEIIQIARCLAEGLHEFHRYYKRAHCDLKPDNIMLEMAISPGLVRKTLINDLGGSTFTTLRASSSPRDNIGCIYTRCPDQFAEGAHPHKGCDLFSFGSILYKLFTGKYLLQSEIDEAETPEKIKEFMAKYTATKIFFRHDILESKIKDIPKPFGKLISYCGNQVGNNDPRFSDTGIDLELKLINCIEEFNRLRKGVDKKRENRRVIRKSIKYGSIGAAILFAGTWALFAMTGSPDYSAKTDLDSRMEYRDWSDSDVTFVAEGELTGHMYPINKDESLRTTFMNTCNRGLKIHSDLGYDFEIDMKLRWLRLFPGNGMAINHLSLGRIAADIFPYAMHNSTVDDKVDLEDAVVITFTSIPEYLEAQRIADSQNYADYISARRADGTCVIDPKIQNFIEYFIEDFKLRIPDLVTYSGDETEQPQTGPEKACENFIEPEPQNKGPEKSYQRFNQKCLREHFDKRTNIRHYRR